MRNWPAILIDARTIVLPKPGSCGQDAAHPRGRFLRRVRCFRSAVADGATAGLCCGPWAEEVVRAYCRGGLPQRHLGPTLRRLRRPWLHYARRRATDWYLRAALRQGAGCTLAGLTVRPAADHEDDDPGRWSALIVGDAALFQVRGRELITRLPFARSDQFSNLPPLLRTDPAPGAQAIPRRHRGSWRDRDRFYLVTDALAWWFLADMEAGGSPWVVLDALVGEPDRFAAWSDRQRRAGTLPVDDIPLTRILVRSSSCP